MAADLAPPVVAEPGAAPAGPGRLRTDVHGSAKPLLRGRIHAAALLAAVPAGVVLVASARTGVGRVAALVYAASLVALFAASSAYHRLGRSARAQGLLRRIDHASIYLLIAGSYTPICLLVLRGAWGWSLLGLVWASALVGVVVKLASFHRSRVIGAVLYIAMGWSVVLVAPLLVGRLPVAGASLLVTGGLLYTVGAVVLARRRPDPAPRIFGYHELWHSLVVLAGLCHYIAIYQVVRGR
jgi:hemolysin III